MPFVHRGKALSFSLLFAVASTGCASLFGLDDPGDGSPDDPPDPPAGKLCVGQMQEVCLPASPTQPVTLGGAFDTGGDSRCEPTISRFCVVGGTEVTVNALAATGARPLVLVATGTLSVQGVLDASSRKQGRVPGPGATDTSCSFARLPDRHGGGAGGSFGGVGADGTGHPSGVGLGAESGGQAMMFVPTDADALIGGCNGQPAGNVTENSYGLGGRGGGAVYLISLGEIVIASGGGINASGEGGAPGQCTPAPCSVNSGEESNAGGGGGSGGMIVLEAPAISHAGRVWADGGGGGQGASRSTNGAAGADPDGNMAALGGATGNTHGGKGGNGSFLAVAALVGTPGDDGGAAGPNGGGGGGGGAGIIRVYGNGLSGPGMFSPPPELR